MSLARVSVLDQTPVSEGMSGRAALANTLDLARTADRLGFHRYWVSEHHGGGMVAGPAPESLIPAIASVTERLRVGSGGVMLPHYSPFKVAETFSLLAGLFPERIDLGLGRAAGTDAFTMFALQRDRRTAGPDDFPQQLAELLGYLRGSLPNDHAFKRLERALPGGDDVPVPWLLGSSPQSAIWAGEAGLPYAFADFINPGGASIAAQYREGFDPGAGGLAASRTMVAVWALAADTEAEAQRLAASTQMTFSELRRGNLIPVPPPERAQRYLRATPQADGFAGRSSQAPSSGRRHILGTPEQVRAGIEEVAEAYGAEEAMVVTITYDHAARIRSYELVADAFGLDAAATPVVAHAAA